MSDRKMIANGNDFSFNVPEIVPLCERLGIACSCALSIELCCDNELERGHYNSDEFKAFCRAAGIPHDLRTRRIEIIIKPHHFPIVRHEYAMTFEAKAKAKAKAADEPFIAEYQQQPHKEKVDG